MSCEIASHPEITVWDKCARLTGSIPWAATKMTGFAAQRMVTWNEYPYNFTLMELAQERGMFFRKLMSQMFQVRRTSGERLDTGLHDYSLYSVYGQHLVSVIHSQLDLSNSDEDLGRCASNLEFTIGNDLDAPSAEDEVELESSLDRAYLDGVTPYVGQ